MHVLCKFCNLKIRRLRISVLSTLNLFFFFLHKDLGLMQKKKMGRGLSVQVFMYVLCCYVNTIDRSELELEKKKAAIEHMGDGWANRGEIFTWNNCYLTSDDLSDLCTTQDMPKISCSSQDDDVSTYIITGYNSAIKSHVFLFLTFEGHEFNPLFLWTKTETISTFRKRRGRFSDKISNSWGIKKFASGKSWMSFVTLCLWMCRDRPTFFLKEFTQIGI